MQNLSYTAFKKLFPEDEAPVTSYCCYRLKNENLMKVHKELQNNYCYCVVHLDHSDFWHYNTAYERTGPPTDPNGVERVVKLQRACTIPSQKEEPWRYVVQWMVNRYCVSYTSGGTTSGGTIAEISETRPNAWIWVVYPELSKVEPYPIKSSITLKQVQDWDFYDFHPHGIMTEKLCEESLCLTSCKDKYLNKEMNW